MQTQTSSGPQDSIRSLLTDIENFCRSYDMAETTFGRQAVNDGKLCQRLRTGKGITINTVHKIQDFIRKKTTLSNPLSLTPDAGTRVSKSAHGGKPQSPSSSSEKNDVAVDDSSSNENLPLKDDRFVFMTIAKNTSDLSTPATRSGR